MLLLHIVHTYFPSVSHMTIFQKRALLDIQNAYAFVLLCYAMNCLAKFLHYQDFTYIMDFLRPFPYYFIGDLLLCTPIMYLHHGASFVLLQIYNHNLQISPNVYYIRSPIYTIAFTEVSTFFLTLKCILHKYRNQSRFHTHLYNISNALFALTFFYTRIYLFDAEFLNGKFYLLFSHYETTLQFILSYLCVYAIVFLNHYWGVLILQKIFTPNVYTTPPPLQN